MLVSIYVLSGNIPKKDKDERKGKFTLHTLFMVDVLSWTHIIAIIF